MVVGLPGVERSDGQAGKELPEIDFRCVGCLLPGGHPIICDYVFHHLPEKSAQVPEEHMHVLLQQGLPESATWLTR
jgi:hypothetical protein